MKKKLITGLCSIWGMFILVSNLQSYQALKPFADYKIQPPTYFLKLMDTSKITYDLAIDTNSTLSPYQLNDEEYSDIQINPMYNLRTNEDGRGELFVDFPTDPNLIRLYDSAEVAIKNDNYQLGKKLYSKLIALDSTWFKAWTNYADCYYLMDELDKAEEYFKKSIQLNPIGYQEYLFLADTYYKQEKYEEALNYIIKALVLNKSNLAIRYSFDRILKANGLELNKDRLTFPIRVNKDSPTKCTIVNMNEKVDLYYPMAICLAVWTMESDYLKRFADDNFEGLYYRTKEILLNHYSYLGVAKFENKPIDAQSERIDELIKNDYLDALIYWDVMASKYPAFMLTLPKEMQTKIAEYIRKYCIIKRK